jgi:hypothetical protein
MMLPAMRQQPLVSFIQIDQYLRCSLKYKFTYVDRATPDFVPGALAFGSGIHGAAALLFGGIAAGKQPTLDEVQGYFEAYWNLETDHKPIRFGARDTKARAECWRCCIASGSPRWRSWGSSSRSTCR